MNVGRIIIENYFRVLKNRWRILHYINAHVDRALGIVVACCVIIAN
jgi:hypothetical protein